MIRLGVCGDDADFLNMLEAHIGEYSRRRHRDIRLLRFAVPVYSRTAYAAESCHIAILDTSMPGQSGIDAARRLFNRNRKCVIAFISASPDFAVDGYGVNAVSYLLKPATPEKLDHMLDKCLERYAELHWRSLVFKLPGMVRKVETSAIRFIESRNKQLHVHCRDEVLVVAGKLSRFLAILPLNFVQTHKSYVANLHYAAAMNRDEVILDGGDKIPVSRQFNKEASKRYFEYMATGT